MVTGAHSIASLPHTHTDMLTGVSFILPVQYYSIGAIPTTVSLPFSSILSTRFNTTEYGDVRYDWDFGDRNILSNTSSSNVSHIYTQPGSLQLTLTAKGFSTTVRNIVTLQIYQRELGSRTTVLPETLASWKLAYA